MSEPAFAGLPDPSLRPTLPVWPDTANILGLGKASAYAAAERGDIPTIRIGRRLLVPTAALRRMLLVDPPAPYPCSTDQDRPRRPRLEGAALDTPDDPSDPSSTAASVRGDQTATKATFPGR